MSVAVYGISIPPSHGELMSRPIYLVLGLAYGLVKVLVRAHGLLLCCQSAGLSTVLPIADVSCCGVL